MLDENANEGSACNGRCRGSPPFSFFYQTFDRVSRLRRSREIPGRTADDRGNLRIAELRTKFASAGAFATRCNVGRTGSLLRRNDRREIRNRRRLAARFAPRERSRKRRKSSCHTHTHIHMHPFTSCAFRANPCFRITISNIARI